MHAGHPVVVSTQPVPDDSAVAQPMTASSLASSAPQNGPGTRRHAPSRARHHSAYINACRAACMYAIDWRNLTGPPQVAPPSRSIMALFPRSVSGYDLREQVAKKLASIDLTSPNPEDMNGLMALAWMVANESLDIKVAIPANAQGEPIVIRGIYHEKVGIVTDREGNRLSFSGSINETWAGWMNNRASFHVHLSCEGGRDSKHVQDEVDAFEKLWSGKAWSVRVRDFWPKTGTWSFWMKPITPAENPLELRRKVGPINSFA